MWQHTIIFFLNDSVHILKRTKNNWINSKSNKTLFSPDFNTSVKKVRDFNSSISLHHLDHDRLLKFKYYLSLKS